MFLKAIELKKLNKMKIKVDFLRKKSLANKNVGLFEVYKYVYKEYKKKVKYLMKSGLYCLAHH